MSVDLFCYTSEPLKKTKDLIKKIAINNSEIFSYKFLISEPQIATENQKYVALEHQFSAMSTFVAHLNDKNAADLVISASEKIKKEFGQKKIIVLHNNDQEI